MEAELPPLDTNIHFLISVSDWRPNEATPLQGFALGLCSNTYLARVARAMPSNIMELTEEGKKETQAIRMSGGFLVNWHPQSERAILSTDNPASCPFVVVLLCKGQEAKRYIDWADACLIRPTIVGEKGADFTYSEFTIESLKARLLSACDLANGKVDAEQLAAARQAITEWNAIEPRKLDYQVGGHATVSPNLAALAACGFRDLVSGPFDKQGHDLGPYIEQMVKTSKSLLSERASVDTSALATSFPPAPILNLFAPAMFSGVSELKSPEHAASEEKRRFRAAMQLLDRQSGYSFVMTTEHQNRVFFPDGAKEPNPHPLFRIRQLELALATECVSSLAAADLSITLRLPNDVNRTSGAARQFAQHYRSNERGPRKRLLSFRAMQERLKTSVPAEFIKLLNEAAGDVRIVSDAHLEWLPVDGLPLCIRRNVSRIPVTPGNLFVELVTSAPPIRLTPSAFQKVLVISALKRNDPIRDLFEVAFDVFEPEWKETVSVEFVEVGSEDELVSALNGFDGALAIFDGHGSHQPKQPAYLHLRDQTCDVWQLQRKVRAPPIIILSACDTHAADRNHATTANGFLSLGARAVLASAFPLGALDAATFAARLLHRVAKFIPAAVGLRGRALNWTEVVSGMIRMQLLTDFLRQLERKNIITKDIYFRVHKSGNFAINGEHSEPFEAVIDELVQAGFDRSQMLRELEIAVAASTAISYLNIGRPETIVLDTEDRLLRALNGASDF